MTHVKIHKLTAVIVLLFFTVTPVHGATVSGVTFQSQVNTDNVRLDLRGAGVLTYMIFIKAYAGALYLPDNVPSQLALTDVPKRLEVEYFHPISGEDFGPATVKGIRDNVDDATFESLKDRIDYHNSLYQDVQPGDRYSLTYTPGNGTELALNGIPKGTIPGADFAAALFSIWIGQKPFDTKFKQALLGQR